MATFRTDMWVAICEVLEAFAPLCGLAAAMNLSENEFHNGKNEYISISNLFIGFKFSDSEI